MAIGKSFLLVKTKNQYPSIAKSQKLTSKVLILEDRNLYLLALSLTKGLGPVSVKNMIAYCGNAKAVFDAPKAKLIRTPGIGKKFTQLVKQKSNLERAHKEVEYCQKHGIEILTYLDDHYPHALKYIHDAPLILFKKGKVDLNAQPNIAIVGTRQATDYGREMAALFAASFAFKGLNVVSGLAYGIDITAHKQVLQQEGITTAVLGHGLDCIYPARHKQKAVNMMHRGGLLTEYLTGTLPEAVHFPARNRIVSGISKAVVVIEAAAKGGALITARRAFDQNRQVYAIPGRIHDHFSRGCNRLIKSDIARLVTSPEEVLEDLDIHWNQHDDQTDQLELALSPPSVPLSADEARVLNIIGKGEILLDQIAIQSGISIDKLNALLIAMEFKDLLRQMPGKKYKRR